MSTDDRKGEGPTRVAPGRETRWQRTWVKSQRPRCGPTDRPSWWQTANPGDEAPPEHLDAQGKKGAPA